MDIPNPSYKLDNIITIIAIYFWLLKHSSDKKYLYDFTMYDISLSPNKLMRWIVLLSSL